MPSLLFKGVNKRRWDWTVDSYPWLLAGERPAAPFSEFRSLGDCEDSVWQVEEGGSNLSRLVAALAAVRKGPDKFDYVLVDATLIMGLSITIVQTEGKSADSAANADWHRDLVELTWEKLIALIHLIRDYGQFTRVPEKTVMNLVNSGKQSGELNPSLINWRT